MLHMTLAANVLNAVGGSPAVDYDKFIPTYSDPLPIGGITVSLARFSKAQVQVFRRIEQPAKPEAPLPCQFILKAPPPGNWTSIGQFYSYIERLLDCLVTTYGEHKVFTRKKELQVRPEDYYGGGGSIVVVTDLGSAQEALKEIIHQGEGVRDIFEGSSKEEQTIQKLYSRDRRDFAKAMPDADLDYAHFFRFNEIIQGRRYTPDQKPGELPIGAAISVDWSDVYPIRPNTKAQDFQNYPDIHRKLVEFNRMYTAVLRLIEGAYRGRQHTLQTAVAKMYQLHYAAGELMQIPDPTQSGQTLGPPFEYWPS
jgi:hypothetical protein